jgi:hypothetical protein
MNEDGKNYRVLFNDYFRQNESRIRNEALKRLEKVPSYRISSTLLKYKKEDHSAFEKSGLESQQIFAKIYQQAQPNGAGSAEAEDEFHQS